MQEPHKPLSGVSRAAGSRQRGHMELSTQIPPFCYPVIIQRQILFMFY